MHLSKAFVTRFGGSTQPGFGDIEFVDNVFNSPRQHALDICDSVVRILHNTRLQSLELNPLNLDRELINALQHAGFVGIDGACLASKKDYYLG